MHVNTVSFVPIVIDPLPRVLSPLKAELLPPLVKTLCVSVCVITPLLYRRQPAALSAEGCLLFPLLSFASTSGTKLLHPLFLLSVFLSFSLPLLQSVTSINQGCKIPRLIFFFLLSLLLKSFLPVSVVFFMVLLTSGLFMCPPYYRITTETEEKKTG